MKIHPQKAVQFVKSLVWILKISYQIDPKKFITRIVVTVCYALLPILSFWMLKLIIDFALTSKLESSLAVKAAIYLIALKIVFDLSWFLFDSFLEGLFKIMRFDLEAYFIHSVIAKLNSLDLGFFEDSQFLDLKQKALDTYSWRPTEFLNVAFWSFYNILQVIFQTVILLQINPVWLLGLFLFQIPALTILVKISQSAWNIWNADSTTRRKFLYFSGLFENLAYIKEFSLYRVGEHFISKIVSLLREFHGHQKKIEQQRIWQGFGGTFLSNLPVFYITFHLLVMTVKKEISPGLLTFYLSSLAAFSLALQHLVKNINFGLECNLYINEIRRFLQIEGNIHQSQQAAHKILKADTYTIEFKNISFSYPSSKRKVFENFSLTIPARKKIALVGENGSGKTTLIKLLCRFYDVQKGNIMINGQDIKDIPLTNLRSLIAVLFQDYVGYDLTVKENIAMGKIQAVDDQALIKNAAMLSGADEFIRKLPNRYDQLLGTAFAKGEQLSIGQWQRIALAKVFMRDSPIIILDEPTAAFDAKTENEIFNKVMSLIKDKSVIMVSHRFSTVRKADEIIVLKEGKIVEKGRHEELIQLDGEYAQMFNLQAQAYQ